MVGHLELQHNSITGVMESEIYHSNLRKPFRLSMVNKVIIDEKKKNIKIEEKTLPFGYIYIDIGNILWDVSFVHR